MDDGTLFERLIKLETRVEILEGELKERPTRIELQSQAQYSSTAETTHSVGSETFICPKVTLSRLIDKRIKMELWLLLGNGELSQWPQLTYTGDEEAVQGFIPGEATMQQLFEELPSETDVSWDIGFKWGRKTGKLDDDGNPTHYKDLVSITERESE